MSGGVDSSVAAALLVQSGASVLGLTMKLWDCADFAAVPAGSGACCSPADAADAARAARKLGAEHALLDMREEFRKLVLEPFCREYAAGRTPNPCVRCNRLLKFGRLADRAAAAGYPALATGHYARVRREKGVRHLLPERPFGGEKVSDTFFSLLRGASRRRDQGYFLAALGQEQLARSRLPVGELGKEEVRKLAAELGLKVAAKPASQDFCFAPDGKYEKALSRYAPEALEPGPLLDSSGRRLGTHRGIGRYTIGQRRGLGVAAGRPLYVTAIRASERVVVVGPESELYARALVAAEVNWIPRAPAGPVRCTVRVRHGGREVPAEVRPLEGSRAEVVFDEPVRAVAPGQFAAFYAGETVLGGGFIERAAGERL
jgi:tRNA-specific 2-thiouridylase